MCRKYNLCGQRFPLQLGVVLIAFTFELGQKQGQLRSAMETVIICSKCVGSTINAGSGFHCSSVLRLLDRSLMMG